MRRGKSFFNVIFFCSFLPKKIFGCMKAFFLYATSKNWCSRIQSLCLRDKLLTPIFSTCTRMFEDVPKVDTRISNFPSKLRDWVIRRTFSIVDSLSLFIWEWRKKQKLRLVQELRKCQSTSIRLWPATHLISISLDLMSPIEFPINDICSSLTPDRLTLIHRNMGTDERSVCKNCGSTRCFLFRSRTEMPSILIWLIVDDFSALEMALNVFVASSRWTIQLQIFNVFSKLKREWIF